MSNLNEDALAQGDARPPKPAGKSRPRVWTVFVATIAGFLAAGALQIAVVLALFAWQVAGGANPQQVAEGLLDLITMPAVFVLLVAVSQLGLGLAALIPARLSATPLRQRLGLLAARPSWSIYPLAVIGSLVPMAIGFGLAEALGRVLAPDPTARMLYEKMTLLDSIPFLLVIAIGPGICEELLFRGYMQRRLLRRWGPAWAIGVTSVIFALVHVAPHTVLLALVLGVWLGYLTWKSGSVFPAMFCHAFVNGSVNLWRVIVKFGEVPTAAQHGVLIAALAAGLVCFVLTIRRLGRHTPLPDAA